MFFSSVFIFCLYSFQFSLLDANLCSSESFSLIKWMYLKFYLLFSRYEQMHPAITSAHIKNKTKQLFFNHFIKILNSTRTDVRDQPVCPLESCSIINFHLRSVIQSMLYQHYMISKDNMEILCGPVLNASLKFRWIPSVIFFFLLHFSYVKCHMVSKKT